MGNESGILFIYCICGHFLFKYFKDKQGPLIKCYLDAIGVDNNVEIEFLDLGSLPKCPQCQRKLGIVKLFHERLAIEVDSNTMVIGEK